MATAIEQAWQDAAGDVGAYLTEEQRGQMLETMSKDESFVSMMLNDPVEIPVIFI